MRSPAPVTDRPSSLRRALDLLAPELRRAPRAGWLGAFLLAASVLPPVGAQQIPGPVVLDPPPNAKFMPVYYTDGLLAMDRHRFLEDPANTVFALTYDFVTLDPLHAQTTPNPDVLLLNYAQFEPAEGVPAATRRLCIGSIERKGLQLYVDYGGAVIDPADPQQKRYADGTFFISQRGHAGQQTVIPTPDLGFSVIGISATRAAMGEIRLLEPGPPQPLAPDGGSQPQAKKAIYVTAGIGYALSDIDLQDCLMASAAASDRLMVYDLATTGKWLDESWRVPASARDGNSSGVAFADFDGDGHDDLYVGLQGDNYTGKHNVLCIYKSATGTFADETARIENGEYEGATTEVAAADLDNDNDLDIVVGNRMRRGGPAGPEAYDYYLLNNGAGFFQRVMLGTVASDTRSVAVANLDERTDVTAQTSPEIVFGNAGSEGLETSWRIPTASDHEMQIYKNTAALPALSFVDGIFTPALGVGMLRDHEKVATTPQTLQVVARDIFRGPGSVSGLGWEPDGWLDLVVVNFREHLKNEVQQPNSFVVTRPPNNVAFLVNYGAATVPAGTPARRLVRHIEDATFWGKCVAFGDFLSEATHPGGALDLFIGCGNRSSGRLASLRWNRGASTPVNGTPFGPLDLSYDILPGTEHGYGFDFADLDGNGYMDALQTARGYDFLARVNDPASSGFLSWHTDFTTFGSLQQTTNHRGRKNPAGMEDGVFADFDADGDLDILLASQRGSSASTPSHYTLQQSASADTIVVHNVPPSRSHAVTVTPTGGAPILVDSKINLNGRTAPEQPTIADRVVAADMDGDDDIDAIVHLFQIQPTTPLGTPANPTRPVNAANGFPLGVASYSFGWRYLDNVVATSSTGHWFDDVAATRMRNASGQFDPLWNRGLGYDVLADFDNNGYLDLYTTHGRATYAVNGTHGSTQPLELQEVMDVAQLDDLLFMNNVSGAAPGFLVEQSAQLLPPRATDETNTDPDGRLYDSAGSMLVAQGDIDNDGDADAIVTHWTQGGRTTLPWLLVNRINEPAAKMVNEFKQRMRWTTLNQTIHTDPAHRNGNPAVQVYPSITNPRVLLDSSDACTLLDWDGDGDLDLVVTVESDLPRFWQNCGVDSNSDGLITSADDMGVTPPRLGYFEDVTDSILLAQKFTPNASDMMTVDVDGDGDLDFAVDSFDDLICLWRNEQVLGVRPRIAEIWPRVGRKQGKVITLHGANLVDITHIEYRFAGQAPIVMGVTLVSDTRARALLPTGPNAKGLAQIRVKRTFEGVDYWSRQYQGYFVIQ